METHPYHRTLLLLSVLLLTGTNAVAAGGLEFVETADGRRSADTRELVQWTHSRMVFNKDLERVAVGRNETLEVEVLNGRDALLLAKERGRTSLIVWYPDQTTETFLFSVAEDLSALRQVLRDIHPKIRLQRAPDRAAMILRGTVPTVKVRAAAEAATRNYFGAGSDARRINSDLVVQSADDAAASDDGANLRLSTEDLAVQSSAAIINLIKVEQLPLSTELKVQNAIKEIGGAAVAVSRIVRGDVEDDAVDTLLLRGTVRNQVALTRVLNIASRLFLGREASFDTASVRAITDESGALLGGRSSGANDNTNRSTGQGTGSGQSNLANSGSVSNLENDIRSNIARAT